MYMRYACSVALYAPAINLFNAHAFNFDRRDVLVSYPAGHVLRTERPFSA